MRPRHILIAGQGATATVFATHLQRAGVQPVLLRRPGSPPHAHALHRLRRRHAPESVTVHLPSVTHLKELPRRPDQFWLCLPSQALLDGWLGEQLQALGNATQVVSWTPDVRDRTRLRQYYAGPILQGMVTFSAFRTPQPFTDLPAGTAWYLPATGAVVQRCPAGRDLARLLRAGGLPALTSRDLPWLAARVNALLTPSAAALEHCDWSLQALRRSAQLGLAARGADEALRISAHYLDHGVGRPLPRGLLLHALTRLLPVFSPMPLAPFLAQHFRKLAPQTRLMLDSWIELGHRHAVPCQALQQLRQQLPG